MIENEKISAPFHRRFAKSQLGGGVLVIVVVEVLNSDHANSIGFKIILGIGIVWGSLWIYAELKHNNFSRTTACITAFVLAALAFSATALAYHQTNLEPIPALLPKPSQFTTFVTTPPEEILKQINDAPPFAASRIAQSFVGTPVEWKLHLYSIDSSHDSTLIVSFEYSRIRVLGVVIPERGNEFLRTAKKGDLFIVRGTIQDLRVGISLDNASIIPIP